MREKTGNRMHSDPGHGSSGLAGSGAGRPVRGTLLDESDGAERMRPLAGFPPAERARNEIVLTDIDDTLTQDGSLPAVAYQALERLKKAGLIVVPVKGRPAGWCDLIARLWPVDAVVGGNG